MMLKLMGLLKRAMAKPLPVIAFRFAQTLQLQWMAQTGAWARLARRAEQLGKVASTSGPVLLADDIPQLSVAQRSRLTETAQDVLASRFKIFGHPVPDLSSCDFATDWRFDQTWPPLYFQRYSFYEQKQIPYDVKFPWELSRLHYLVPVVAWLVVKGADAPTLQWILAMLRRWRQSNPLAYSVNWYPMEASMRITNLVLILDLVNLLLRRGLDTEMQKPLIEIRGLLLTMIREHGDFVWINREFTDVRGNHFTANLVGLQLGYLALAAHGKGPSHWQRYVDLWLEKEIFLQFCADGVNFEKSCGYHKLVLELFLLAGIARERKGSPLSAGACQRLTDAAFFSQAISRPDGSAANFGDNDNAIALPFQTDRPHSHGAAVELARAWTGEAIGTLVFDDEDALAALFLIGRRGPAARPVAGPEILEFPAGGYVVVRNVSNGFFCMMDVGEVGMAGRGGHGHNDMLAFELCIDGQLVIVDPGCSGYTADLAKKTRYRSTAAHATIQLYGEEMARFAGHWVIRNDAIPTDVSTIRTENGARVSAGHDGYSRFEANSRVVRCLDIDAVNQTVFITDEINAPHGGVPVRWHFPVGNMSITLIGSRGAYLSISDYSINMKADVLLGTLEAPFSVGYGQESIGNVIIGESILLAGCNRYQFSFRKHCEGVNS
jgi:hypothetical protein